MKKTVTKTVTLVWANPESGDTARLAPKEMTREEFLQECGEFYDNRGTHCDDFEVMQARISVEGAK